MAHVNVLLLKQLKGHGDEGKIVRVKAGFARNFLVPKGWAVPEFRANKKQVEALCKAREMREARELEEAKTLASKINIATLTIAVKTGEGGKLFGSVSNTDLLKCFAEKEGIVLDKECVRLSQPIKTLGHHAFQVRLHKDVVLDVPVEVVSENPIE